ncbi:HAD family hydrolase [Chitinophaga sp. LS1]|uniref:HAD family hydrolase n=1 Tax=Chitinophaga sp. LS1 TaxID=3051176 RepID=UPI002AAAA676|nr:HAD family hydrolase [Chitinophaga sp. LS1]WPV65714.1 HAD family hydrolase [Chitinophaga sp. LS1]
MMNHYNYYLFDYDGTICNTFPTIHSAMSQTFEKSGLNTIDKITMLSAVSKGGALHDTIRHLLPEASKLNFDDVEAIAKIYREQYKECDEKLTVLFEGAAAVFEKLKAQDKTIIVLSNKGIAAVERSLKALNLFDQTDLIIAEGAFPDLALKLKPDPMVYETIITQNFNIKNKEEVLMTGDTHADILFANNCGIASCWAAYGYGQKDACEVLHPTYTIQEISEII